MGPSNHAVDLDPDHQWEGGNCWTLSSLLKSNVTAPLYAAKKVNNRFSEIAAAYCIAANWPVSH